MFARLFRPTAPGPPDPVRALRARRAVEHLLVLAIVADLWAHVAAVQVEARGRDDTSRTPSGSVVPWTSLPVDVATDGPSRLRLLPGLGVVRTKAVLDDRARNGPVTAVEGLQRIRGFGPKTVTALRSAGAIVAPARGAPQAGLPPEARPRADAR